MKVAKRKSANALSTKNYQENATKLKLAVDKDESWQWTRMVRNGEIEIKPETAKNNRNNKYQYATFMYLQLH